MFFMLAARTLLPLLKSSSGMETDIEKLTGELQPAYEPSAAAQHLQSKKTTLAQLFAWTGSVQSILLRLRQVDSFVACLLAQNMKDSTAQSLNAE